MTNNKKSIEAIMAKMRADAAKRAAAAANVWDGGYAPDDN